MGTKTATYLDVRDQGFATISATGLTGSDTHLWPEINGRIVGDLRDEIGHFAEAVLDGKPFVQPYQDALAAIRVLDALFESVRTDAPVNVVH